MLALPDIAISCWIVYRPMRSGRSGPLRQSGKPTRLSRGRFTSGRSWVVSAADLAGAIQELETDVTHQRMAYHYLTAIFDKLSGAGLIAARQDTAANQP